MTVCSVMHPQYSQFLEFMQSCEVRQSAEVLEACFEVWLKNNECWRITHNAQVKIIEVYKEEVETLKREIFRLIQEKNIQNYIKEKLVNNSGETGLLERVNDCKRTFMLAELVDLQRVQSISAVNDVNFCVTMVSGHQVFGNPDKFECFVDKYMSFMEGK